MIGTVISTGTKIDTPGCTTSSTKKEFLGYKYADMFWERSELHFIAGTRARIDLDESGQINSKLEEKWVKLGATTQVQVS